MVELQYYNFGAVMSSGYLGLLEIKPCENNCKVPMDSKEMLSPAVVQR